jgi:hypothetical protein
VSEEGEGNAAAIEMETTPSGTKRQHAGLSLLAHAPQDQNEAELM